MKKLNTLALSFLTLMLAITLFTSCSKSAAQPTDEQLGPKETVALPLFNDNEVQVGSVYIDQMHSGRAQAKISMYDGNYTVGESMKTNVTLTTPNGISVYAHCKDLDGYTGKCSTFPIRVLSNNSDAMFSDITTNNGIVFNVLDKNGNIVARSAKHVIVME